VTDRFAPLRRLAGGEADRLATRAAAFDLVWAGGVGGHLGSYFWSAIAKIQAAGGDPLFWVLHNPTQTAIALALERGDSPLATWPHVLQAAWDGIIAAQPLLNVIVFAVQLLSPLAALSVPALVLFCLVFDAFHVAIYMTLGALFFFWILVNLAIAAGAAPLRGGGFTRPMKTVMALSIVFGHFFFYTNHLGWLDSAKLVSPTFYAVTRDHREVAVPAVYFGIYSYSIAQTIMYVPDDHFPFRLAGNVADPETWKDAVGCGPQTLRHQDTGVSLDAVRRMIGDTDRLMRRNPAVKADNLYYFYPHHMVPNPWLFTAFNDLTIDDIVSYEYVVESVCLSVRDGRLVRDVHKRSVFPVDAR
jgi:hypothetical protein